MISPLSNQKALSVPIYPRPVSPLHYEPLNPKPEDLLWEQDFPDSSDKSETARAAKKRRIECLGEQYLRGHGLFIMSAAIRGPLGNGWKNPWQQTKLRKQEKSIERPRSRRPNGDLMKPTGQKGEVLSTANKSSMAEDIENREGQQNRRKILPAKVELSSAKLLKKDPDDSEIQHEQIWLKKKHTTVAPNCDIYAGDAQEVERSPSARVKPSRPQKRRLSRRESVEATRSSATDSVSDGRAETVIKRLKKVDAPVIPPHSYHRRGLDGSTSITDQDITTRESQPLSEVKSVQPAELASPSERHWASNRSYPPSSRMAEQNPASLSASSLPGQRGPLAEANGSGLRDGNDNVLSAAEFRDTRDRSTEPSPSRQSGNERGIVNGSLECSNTHYTLTAPTPSTEATSATMVNLVPSAQVVLPIQPPPNESMPSTGDRLSERQIEQLYHFHRNKSNPSTQAAMVAASLQLHHELRTPITSNSQSIVPSDTMDAPPAKKSNSGITPFSAFESPHYSATRAPATNIAATQELLEAVGRIQPNTTVRETSSPSSTRPQELKGVVEKECKRTVSGGRVLCGSAGMLSSSNGSSSSQGSIKASLKVSKQHSRPGKESVEERKSIGPNQSGVDGYQNDPDSSISGPQSRTGGNSESYHQSENANTSYPRQTISSTYISSHSNLPDAQQQDLELPRATFESNKVSNVPTNDVTTGRSTESIETNAKKPPATAPGPQLHSPSTSHPPSPPTLNHETREVKAGFGTETGKDEEAEKEGDVFDLSDAMDTVGSFLQTWDVEKEYYRGKRKTG